MISTISYLVLLQFYLNIIFFRTAKMMFSHLIGIIFLSSDVLQFVFACDILQTVRNGINSQRYEKNIDMAHASITMPAVLL